MKNLAKLRDITGWSVLIIFLILISSKLFAGDPVLLQDGSKKKNEPKNKTGVFYGKKVKGKKVVFCLDASGSMKQSRGVKQPDDPSGVSTGSKEVPDLPDLPANSSKLDIAKWELKKAILGLTKKQGFNIVFYDTEVKVWQKKRIIPATPKAKRAAFKWIDKIKSGSNTNIYGGLKASLKIGIRPQTSNPLKYAADTIYLLSDGQPSGGKIDDPKKLREKVREWNKRRKATIHTVAVGTNTGIGAIGGGAERFLKKLAKENNGEFIKP